MNRMDRNSFKTLVESVNTVLKTDNSEPEINERLLENCINSIDEQFLNEGIELTEDQLQELWAGLKAAGKHLFSGKLRGIRDVASTAEQDAASAHIEKHAKKKFERAQNKAKGRADFLYKTGDAKEGDREYAELTGTAQRRAEDLTYATASKRSEADAPRLGGKARKDAEQTQSDLVASRGETARVTGERDQAREEERRGRVKRRGIRVGAANKGDAKQQKHLDKVIARSGHAGKAGAKVKGVDKKTGHYVVGGKGMPDIRVEQVMNFVKNIIKD